MKNVFTTVYLLVTANYLIAQNVGVGTTTPTEKLHVAGNVRSDTIKTNGLRLAPDAGAGKILTSDANGNATWRTTNVTAAIDNLGYGAWGDCATNQAISGYNPMVDEEVLAGDSYGASSAVSGDYAIIGSPTDDVGANVNQGSASIYHYDGSNWIFIQKLVDPAGAANDQFGKSVTISGNFVIIGAPRDDNATTDQGSVTVFRLIGAAWTYQTKFTGGTESDGYGESIALDGIYLAVGCPHRTVGADANQGVVFTYRFDGTNWVIMNTLNDALGLSGDLLGSSVAISGDYLVAGAPNADVVAGGNNRGSIVTWRRSGTSWLLMQRITGVIDSDALGYSVGISENFMVVGIPNDERGANTDQGSARIYQRNGTAWEYVQELYDRDGSDFDVYGLSVSIAGDYLMIGGKNRIVDGRVGQGNVIVYARLGRGFQKLQMITDPAGEVNDNFGAFVALGSNKRFVISVPGYSSTGKVVFGKLN